MAKASKSESPDPKPAKNKPRIDPRLVAQAAKEKRESPKAPDRSAMARFVGSSRPPTSRVKARLTKTSGTHTEADLKHAQEQHEKDPTNAAFLFHLQNVTKSLRQ